MIKIGPNYDKLKASLRLASTRLKILQSKKLEIVERTKAEVADNIKSGKFMQAKIKAHKIIREEVTAEAMELIEMYCDQILERYELFQKERVPDITLTIPISSLIWVAPYFQSYIEDLKVISKQMTIKYGARFCRETLRNKSGNVNLELIERVRQFMPSDENVEKCLRKVCSKYGIAYSKKVKESLKGLSSSTPVKQSGTHSINIKGPKGNNTEFEAEGVSKTDDPISSKKAFTKIMGKFKIKKSTRQTENNTKISSDGKLKDNAVNNSSAARPKDKCVVDGKYFQGSKEDSKESNLKLKASLDNKDIRSEIASKNLIHESNEDVTEKHEPRFSVTSECCTDTFRGMYLDPPPPYNFLYFNEKESEIRANVGKTLRNDIQLPTCPDEKLEFSPSKCYMQDENKTKH